MNKKLIFDHYAVIQNGYAIFGVGETEEEAREDAAQWLDDSKESLKQESGIDGGICCVNCTKSLHDAVKENGTLTWADHNDGICLPKELQEAENE